VKRFRLTAPKIKLVEDDVERACIDLLRLRGYYVVRLQSGFFRTPDGRGVRVGEPGLPDYACMKRDFFLETKRPGAKLSPAQEKKVFELEKGYGIAVATVDRVEHLARWLDDHEKKAGTAPGL
jgi:hypothetical protein